MSLLEINQKIESCRSCKFRDTLRYGDLPLIGRGSEKASIMCLNLRATIEAHLVEKPLATKTEVLFNKILSESGLSYNDIYLTNLVKCAGPTTPAKAFYNNGKSCEFTHLDNEIAHIKPKAIVCFGTSIPKFLFNDKMAAVGSHYIMPNNGPNVFVTYSMEELYRKGQAYMDSCVTIMKKAKEC